MEILTDYVRQIRESAQPKFLFAIRELNNRVVIDQHVHQNRDDDPNHMILILSTDEFNRKLHSYLLESLNIKLPKFFTGWEGLVI